MPLSTLDKRHQDLAEARAQGKSYAECAEITGLSKTTCWRLCQDDLGSGVPALIAEIQSERIESTKARAIEYAVAALDHLHRLMTEGESEHIQLQAAKALWNSFEEQQRQTHMDRTLAVIKALDQLDDGGEW